MQNPQPLKISLAAIFMIIFWAAAYVGIRAGLKGYSPGPMALFRYLVASVCMFFIYNHSLKFRRIAGRDLLSIAVLGVLGFAVYNIALNYGEISVPAGIASFIIAQIPVLITLFAVLFYQDRLTKFGWLGTAVSFFGILLIALSDRNNAHFTISVFYVLIATLSGSCYSILQKPLLKRLHPIEFTAIAIWFGTLAMLFYLPQLIREIPTAPLSATLAVIFNGIFPAAIAYILWSYVLSNLPITKAASFLYVVPIITTLMGAVWLKEIPSSLAITGGLIALLGAFLVNRGVLHKT